MRRHAQESRPFFTKGAPCLPFSQPLQKERTYLSATTARAIGASRRCANGWLLSTGRLRGPHRLALHR